ncbi:hypothetical protein ALI22I_30975 [Saccharothrix sp. ALI-22-I]|uniref:hypothetical protein n=1 Tax=Saccharothrix sp. ALI-22-I TaxID=1933778 RepID=UPI00097BE023|nr:hypothetical protein [Saccharothrix sp. ALI-22-I]ONI84893.1 hypothetical protein ALI22I_30975 [Saccharothrix sp. ALI-22-I]
MLLLTAVLLTSCTGDPEERDPAPPESADFVVSYAGAAGRLNGLDPVETKAQTRDWARTALAAHLELDSAKLRDTAYDTLPMRDDGFSDLSRQSTGPGRSLFDGETLHLLVATDDPHRARTIGQLLDQHRTDSGGDPQRVRVHPYTVHPETGTIDITAEEPASAADIRAANGYVSMRVDDKAALTDFLAKTEMLSTLEARDGGIWAGGWNWPDENGAGLTLEEVSTLQRGYLGQSSTPGFSLDPGPPETPEDLRVALPNISGELIDRVLGDVWVGSPFASSDELAGYIELALYDNSVPAGELAQLGLTDDRVQLWGLLGAINGQSVYSQARYDGGLAGTTIGVTLFYTDYIAKDWSIGVGTGVPAKAVEGFLPDPDARTPWSHCDTGALSESGRLWLGQNDSAFAFDDKSVSIGAQSTRLFSRSDGGDGGEVEPSYAFGRGLKWWDRNYQAVADYEPQYQRLDQIMRWSGALEWLVAKTSARLPQLSDSEIRSDLSFAEWYAGNGDLRERSPIRFISPPSATEEAVLQAPSKTFDSCGYQTIYGGVSLGDVIARKGAEADRANLPGPVNRAGAGGDSSFDPATGKGSVKQKALDADGKVVDSLEHRIDTSGDVVTVEAVGGPRKVVALGGLKLMVDGTRAVKTRIDAKDGRVSQRAEYLGHEVGELTAVKDRGLVTVEWRRGVLDRARIALESFQSRLSASPDVLPPAKDGVLHTFRDPTGGVEHRVDGEWSVSIGGDQPPPGDVTFRLGAPSPGGGDPRFLYGTLKRSTEPPADSWVDVTPAAADQAAVAVLADRPAGDARTVKVTTKNGESSTVHVVGDHVRYPADDPVLGGTAEGMALTADFPRVLTAVNEAVAAKDGLYRPIRLLDDGLALVGESEIRLVSGNDAWAFHVRSAVHGDGSRKILVRLEGDHALLIDKGSLDVGPRRDMTLGEAVDQPATDPYVHESFRSSLTMENGRIAVGTIPRDTKVRVREAVVVGQPVLDVVTRPDVRSHGGAEWLRVNPPRNLTSIANGGNQPTVTSPAPTTTTGTSGSTGSTTGAGATVLLICPDTDDEPAGCDDE